MQESLCGDAAYAAEAAIAERLVSQIELLFRRALDQLNGPGQKVEWRKAALAMQNVRLYPQKTFTGFTVDTPSRVSVPAEGGQAHKQNSIRAGANGQ